MWRMGQSLEVALAEVNLGRLEIRLMPLELPKAAQGNWRGRGKTARKPAHKGGAKPGRTTRPGGSRSGWKITSPGDESGKSGGQSKGRGAGKGGAKSGGRGKSSRRSGAGSGGTGFGGNSSGSRTGKKRGR